MNPDQDKPNPEPNATGGSAADISGDDATTSSANDVHAGLTPQSASDPAPVSEPPAVTPEATASSEPSVSASDQADVVSAIDQLASDAAAAAGEPAPEPTPSVDTTTASPESPTTSTPSVDIAAAAAELDAEAGITPSATPTETLTETPAVSEPSTEASETEPVPPVGTSIPVTEAPTTLEPAAPITSEPTTTETSVSDAATPDTNAPDTNAPANDVYPTAASLHSAGQTSESEMQAKEIKPADPVPGSIGSALSYSPTAPNHSEPTPKPTKTKPPKTAANKKNSFLIAIIIIAAVALVAVVVVFILFIITNNNNNNKTNTNSSNNNNNSSQAQVETQEASLICTYTSTSEDLADKPSIASYEQKIIANYFDDALVDFSTNDTYNYISEDAASEGSRRARLDYGNIYNQLGFNTDPFASNYPVSGTKSTITHYAEAEKIDNTNASLLGLSLDANNDVITSLADLRQYYLSKNYTCVSSDEEEFDNNSSSDNNTNNANDTDNTDNTNNTDTNTDANTDTDTESSSSDNNSDFNIDN